MGGLAIAAILSFLDALVGRFMKKPFYKFADKTTDEILRSLTNNETLIKVLSGQSRISGTTLF